MNEKNFEYLNDQVRFSGFGDLGDDLKAQMKKRKNGFELEYSTVFNGDEIKAALKFSKSKESDMYFFNSYDVALKREGEKDPMKQSFYINNRGSSITLKEAYNLMQGRAVNKDLTNKEGQTYNAWLQMDFKNTDEKGNYLLNKYYDSYGFDLEKSLSNYPIKEMTVVQYKNALMDSLKKGNRQTATFVKDGGKQVKYGIEASPQFKTINIYDENNRLRLSKDQKQVQSQKQDDTTQSTGQSAKRSANSKAESMKDDAKTEKLASGQRRTGKRSVSM